MRKSIALVMALMVMVAPAPFNTPARAATMVEYGLLVGIIALIVAADLPQSQKESLTRTVESWKNLPATKNNIAYVEKNAAQIKKLLATASDPKSQAALQKYIAKGNVGLKNPTNSNVTMRPSESKAAVQPQTNILSSGGSKTSPTTTTAPSALTSPSLLGGSGGSAATGGSKAKLPTSGATTLGH
jgi:hypothetical protein